MENTVKKNPAKVFTCGAVKAAIWADSRVINNTVVELHSVRTDKSYKNKDSGEWRHTNTFAAENLPKVVVVAMGGYEFIRLRSSEQDRTEELRPGNSPENGSEVLG